MQIAIIGSGNVGSALGKGWGAKGHTIIYGTRHPGSAKMHTLLAEVGGDCSAVSPAEAAAAGEVVVLATPWDATKETIASLGDLSGKIVVDATNPLAPGLKLAVSGDDSGGERVAGWAGGAKVVKAFNTTGANNMLNPIYAGESTTMFICGDDAGAKAAVTQLAEDLGFDVADVGDLEKARYVEALALVWINLAMVQGLGREIALKLVRR